MYKQELRVQPWLNLDHGYTLFTLDEQGILSGMYLQNVSVVLGDEKEGTFLILNKDLTAEVSTKSYIN